MTDKPKLIFVPHHEQIWSEREAVPRATPLRGKHNLPGWSTYIVNFFVMVFPLLVLTFTT